MKIMHLEQPQYGKFFVEKITEKDQRPCSRGIWMRKNLFHPIQTPDNNFPHLINKIKMFRFHKARAKTGNLPGIFFNSAPFLI
jgi:hypothetical protein